MHPVGHVGEISIEEHHDFFPVAIQVTRRTPNTTVKSYL
jgi:hypothetical protein